MNYIYRHCDIQNAFLFWIELKEALLSLSHSFVSTLMYGSGVYSLGPIILNQDFSDRGSVIVFVRLTVLLSGCLEIKYNLIALFV